MLGTEANSLDLDTVGCGIIFFFIVGVVNILSVFLSTLTLIAVKKSFSRKNFVF
jgi:hypothetical protein